MNIGELMKGAQCQFSLHESEFNIGELMKGRTGAQCQFSLDESEPIFNIGGLMKGRTGAQCQFFGLVGDDEFGYTKTKLLNEKKNYKEKITLYILTVFWCGFVPKFIVPPDQKT